MLLLDGNALGEKGLAAAARVAAASGCRVYSTTFPARVEAGPELFPVSRLPYFPEQILELLSALRTLVLVGSDAPVSFFAYRGQPSSLVPQNCVVRRLNHRHQDGAGALSALADAIDAGAAPTFAKDAPATVRPELPTGELSNRAVGQVLAALAPDGSVVTSDSGGGGAAFAPMQRSVRHTWLHLTGGAIGQAGPVAVGAAVACPERPVFALIGDGAAMYTNQFLWTTAREQLKVITVIYSNRSYGILDVEYRRLGINQVGARAASLFDLSGPDLDWTAMAQAQGVPGPAANLPPRCKQRSIHQGRISSRHRFSRSGAVPGPCQSSPANGYVTSSPDSWWSAPPASRSMWRCSHSCSTDWVMRQRAAASWAAGSGRSSPPSPPPSCCTRAIPSALRFARQS
jgi:acetolactate synthase-1/2/3 large subunit